MMWGDSSADVGLRTNALVASIEPEPRRTTLLQGRKVGFAVAVLNVMNAIMGSGILALPSLMAANGLVLYSAMQAGMMLVVDFSLYLLCTAAFHARKYS